MEKDKYTIKCFNCDKVWICEVETSGEVNWICSDCGNSDKCALIHYEPGDPDFHNRKLETGKGGAFHA